jgi:pyruvate kinase
MARLVSEYRPRVPIIGLTSNRDTYQSLALYWGVTPLLFNPSSNDVESMLIDMDQAILRRELFAPGARVIVTFAHPIQRRRSVNLLKLHEVGTALDPKE